MSILKQLRTLFKKPAAQPRFEYIKTWDYADPQAVHGTTHMTDLLGEVDFSHQGDLESYVRGLTIPKEVIERWISAGLLYPEEMKTAEKMIKIMIENERHACL
jgi:hypothetical protein